MNYIIEVSDKNGKSCQIALSIPFYTVQTQITNSTWRVLDEGFIKYRSGGCEALSEPLAPVELLLGRGVSDVGIRLYDFASSVLRTINDSGEGFIRTKWCVNLKPTRITWVVLEG